MKKKRVAVGAHTSGGRYTPAKGNNGSNIIVEKLLHLFDEFPPDTRMPTNEGIHAYQDRSTDPGLRHGR